MWAFRVQFSYQGGGKKTNEKQTNKKKNTHKRKMSLFIFKSNCGCVFDQKLNELYYHICHVVSDASPVSSLPVQSLACTLFILHVG